MSGEQMEFDFCIAMSSEYDNDGHLGTQPDACGNAGFEHAETLFPFGMCARTLDPDDSAGGTPQSGCTALHVRHGTQNAVMPLNDPRVVPKLPKLRKGGSMLYCGSGSFALFDGMDPDGVARAGSFTVGVKYTSGGKGKSHMLEMACRTDGKEAVSLKHAEGHGIAMTNGGKRSTVIKNASGNRYIEVNDDEVVIAGKLKIQGSTTIGQMGAADSLVKLKALAAYCTQIEAKLASLGAPVAMPFGSALDLLGTQNLKGS